MDLKYLVQTEIYLFGRYKNDSSWSSSHKKNLEFKSAKADSLFNIAFKGHF